MSITLVVNPGRVSKKYALYCDRSLASHFLFEKKTNGFEMCSHTGDGLLECTTISADEYETSFTTVASAVKKYLSENQTTLDQIAIRVVSPGKQFQSHQIIDETFIMALRQKEFSMPLHIPFTLQEIQNCKREFRDTRMIAVSDSAFHTTLPGRARDFSIDRSDAETYDIYRFGHHGLSVASVVERVHPVTGNNPKRLVVCHVGHGVSVTAVLDGKSVDTSMGYSPTSGLPMGSQVGDIDPGGLLALMRAKNLKPSEAEMYIHSKGGLYGLSETDDIRRLLDGKSKGEAVAIQTLDLFVYQIQKAIAASTVALGGIDMLVLTGTACSRSSELRSLLVAPLSYLGLDIDENRNEVLLGQDGVCSSKDAKAKVVTIRTDEMSAMAREVDVLNITKS